MKAAAAMLPNVFLVGAPKAGTTFLARWLALHPDVFVSNPKEPSYFCTDRPNLRIQHGISSFGNYLELFEHSENCQVRIDASTAYLSSTVAVREILSRIPDARFIVMVRQPAEIAHAFHMEQVFGLNEPESDFETAWRLVEKRRSAGEPLSRDPQFLDYDRVASIGTQLEDLIRLVGSHKVLVLRQSELIENASETYLKACSFLGLEFLEVPLPERVNVARRHRFPLLARLVLTPPDGMSPIVNRVRSTLNKSDLASVERFKKVFRPPTKRVPMSEALWDELSEHFHVESLKVEEIIGGPI